MTFAAVQMSISSTYGANPEKSPDEEHRIGRTSPRPAPPSGILSGAPFPPVRARVHAGRAQERFTGGGRRRFSDGGREGKIPEWMGWKPMVQR